MIAIDTSVLVRYLVGSPPDSARRAAALIDGTDEVGLPLTVLLETGHVLRTQYGIDRASVLETLLGVVTRRNMEILGGSRQATVEALTRARSLPGAALADALIAATVRESGVRPLYSFDAGLARHGIDVARPDASP